MKSYTDIEQSKKLAEILPLESADMMYSPPMLTHFKSYGDADKEQELPDYMVINVRRNIINSSKFDEPIPIRKGDIPAWSLAALLGVLLEIQGGKPVIALDDNYITYPHMSDLHTKADNLVDACVEMIIKLSELNLL